MEVSPFRGIRYNQSIVGDLARVICPPYDVIAADQERLYYKKSDWNAIRLELPEPAGGRYQRAAITFRKWLGEGVLRYDSTPSFYLHEHRFEYSGEKKMRRGLIARVRLEPWGSGIFPHEETSSKAKRDRLRLARACRANFSPLLCLYYEPEQEIAAILSHVAQERALISLQGERSNLPDSGEAHNLWMITDPEIKQQLSQLLSSQPLYIADGHHRYETALTYQQKTAQEQSDWFGSSVIGSEAKQSVAAKEAFRYVMMELVEFSDPGLVILPLHRLVRGLAHLSLLSLADKLRAFFALESVPLSTGSWRLPVDSCLGILGLRAGSLVALKKRQDISLEAMMPGNRSEAYREFGVSILNHIVLEKILNGAKSIDIAYTVNLKDAQQQIGKGKYQLAFLLHPAQPDMIKAVADCKDRMPRKSTYFYPKLPAGLVINTLD